MVPLEYRVNGIKSHLLNAFNRGLEIGLNSMCWYLTATTHYAPAPDVTSKIWNTMWYISQGAWIAKWQVSWWVKVKQWCTQCLYLLSGTNEWFLCKHSHRSCNAMHVLPVWICTHPGITTFWWMAWCKTAVSSVRQQWIYYSLALNHRFEVYHYSVIWETVISHLTVYFCFAHKMGTTTYCTWSQFLQHNAT